MTMDQATAADASLFAEHLRAHAAEYFRDLVGVPLDVQLVRAQVRPFSRLFEFSLTENWRETRVLIKAPVPYASAPGVTPDTRPRLAPPSDPALSCVMEHAALAAIERHFRMLGDPRFGAIRVLALLPDSGALVMERVQQPSLRALLVPSSRWGSNDGRARVDAAFRNAGAWLQSYHSSDAHSTPARHARRSELIDFIDSVCGWLGDRLANAAFYQRLAAAIAAEAAEVLPENLPLGLSHGDFAVRNILAGPGGVVTVCDTRSRWRTAIHEDIGYFLAGLKYGWPQLYTGGLALRSDRLVRWETLFLEGYYGNAIAPLRAIRLYETLALLDRIAGVAARRPSGRAPQRRMLRSLQLALLEQCIRSTTRDLLKAGARRQETFLADQARTRS